jgi:hypothetical protein
MQGSQCRGQGLKARGQGLGLGVTRRELHELSSRPKPLPRGLHLWFWGKYLALKSDAAQHVSADDDATIAKVFMGARRHGRGVACTCSQRNLRSICYQEGKRAEGYKGRGALPSPGNIPAGAHASTSNFLGAICTHQFTMDGACRYVLQFTSNTQRTYLTCPIYKLRTARKQSNSHSIDDWTRLRK